MRHGGCLASWRFLESEADGQIWLNSPAKTWAFIEVADADRQRLMVATKAWAESHINEVKGPRTWAVFAAMLIVPDGTPQQLRASIDAAVAMGAVRHFGHPASSSEPAA